MPRKANSDPYMRSMVEKHVVERITRAQLRHEHGAPMKPAIDAPMSLVDTDSASTTVGSRRVRNGAMNILVPASPDGRYDTEML